MDMELQPTMQTEIELAREALERIAHHEKECGERWAEAVAELKSLRIATDSHAARWERLAWLVIGVVVTSFAGILLPFNPLFLSAPATNSTLSLPTTLNIWPRNRLTT